MIVRGARAVPAPLLQAVPLPSAPPDVPLRADLLCVYDAGRRKIRRPARRLARHAAAWRAATRSILEVGTRSLEMEKRIFLAVVISIALLGLWAWSLPKFFPELAKKPEPAKLATATTATTTAATSDDDRCAATGYAAGRRPRWRAADVAAPRRRGSRRAPSACRPARSTRPSTPPSSRNRGAQLVSFKLKNYKRKDDPKQTSTSSAAREPNRTDFPFAIEAARPARSTTRLNTRAVRGERPRPTDGAARRSSTATPTDGITATKTFRFDPRSRISSTSRRASQPPMPYRVAVGPGIRNARPEESGHRRSSSPATASCRAEGKFEDHPAREGRRASRSSRPSTTSASRTTTSSPCCGRRAAARACCDRDDVHRSATTKKRRTISTPASTRPATASSRGNAFFGPKETKLLDRYGIGEALQFGWFGIIARFFLDRAGLDQPVHARTTASPSSS